MPDYKKLYYIMFHASEDAARLLLEAQCRAEEELLRTDCPPLVLSPKNRPPLSEGSSSVSLSPQEKPPDMKKD